MRAQWPVVGILAWVLGAGGCVEDDKSFFIRQNQIPDSDCLVSTDATEFRGAGLLDVSGGYGYYMYPLVENGLMSTAGDNQPERNALHMTGFSIEIDLGSIPGSYPDEVLDFVFLVSGTIDPGGQAAYAGIEVIKAELVKRLSIPKGLRPVVTVSMRAIAKRSGEEMESAEFVFPVTLCNGCLVDFRNTCPLSTDKTILTNECGLPQDSAVTCCPTTGGLVTCFSGS